MNAKFAVVVLFLALSVLYFKGCEGAPRPSKAELLEKSIAEYLRHDPQLIRDLQNLGFGDTPNGRAKRQSEFDGDSNDPDLDVDGQKPGFFDRAAKFVVELLQRFLRWVNTDGS